MSEPVNSIIAMMSAGQFEVALIEAQKLMGQDLSPLEAASCLYAIGSCKNALGDLESALPFLLESLSTFPKSESLLIGHVQEELARVQFDLKLYNSALFFVEMAISNFELGENPEMKASCEALREEILWQA
jgi:tetratricopeptide (TPR) repeat protein